MLLRLIGLVMLASVFCLGCGKSEPEPKPEPKPLTGQWLLSITQEYQPGDFRNISTVLLEVRSEDGKYKAELKGSKPALPRAKLQDFSVEGNRVHVVLAADRYTFDFQGQAKGDTIRGNMDQGGFIIEPALLTRKNVREVSDAPDFELPSSIAELHILLQKASGGQSESVSLVKNYEAFKEFCDQHGDSPLAIIYYHALVNVLPEKASTTAEVKAFADAYLKKARVWGERMQTMARFNLAKRLVREAEFADIGLEYLEQVESELDVAKKADVQRQLDFYRQMAEGAKSRSEAKAALQLVNSGKPEGMETLRALNERSPFDPVLMYCRAEAARLSNQPGEALKYNAQLAVWPRLQSTLQADPVWQDGEQKLPEGLFLEQWVNEHGSEAGLEEYKTEIYNNALELIAKQIGSPSELPTGNRVNVMELFTGTKCPPCLGADLATGALELIYAPTNLVVLRYHVHTNGLDPLTNPRNMERFQSLLDGDEQAQMGTPSVFLNGLQAESNVGGYLDNAPQIGMNLQAELRPHLNETTPLALDLSANQHEGEISISAKLTGAPPSQRDKLRVLLLLAEKDLLLNAPNGIRKHEMLVRWFFNDGKSLALADSGEFQYAAKISLQDIRQLLESSTKSAAEQMQLDMEPVPLDLDDLQLVALVHDGGTREILQAGVIPVNVFDTSPPMPNLPTPKPPTEGPMLKAPSIGKSEPAEAEKNSPTLPKLPLPKSPAPSPE